MRKLETTIGGLLAVFLLTLPVSADWPQILGPARNGHATDTRLHVDLDETGPQLQWQHPIGEGFAGPAILGDTVIVFHRIGENEVVDSLNLLDGSLNWTQSFDASYRPGVNPDQGPRCVPLIENDHVYVFGAAGLLHCLELTSGDKVWSRDVYGEFLGDQGYFGAGSTPIAVDGKLLLNVGGRREAGIVAFDLLSGETVWQVGSDRASYSSPTVANIGGEDVVVFVTRLHALGINPSDGSEVFRFEFGMRGATVNAATPLVCDDRLFFSASYGVGCVMARIKDDSVEIEWQDDETMSSQYSTCLYQEGFLYGTHGREDVGRVSLRCIDSQTGQVRWSKDDFGVAHLIGVGDDLLILTVEGECVIAPRSSQSFEPALSVSLMPNGSRALPALSQGKLVARSNAVGGEAELNCWTVGESIR